MMLSPILVRSRRQCKVNQLLRSLTTKISVQFYGRSTIVNFLFFLHSLSTTHLLISRAREIVYRRATWTFVLLCNCRFLAFLKLLTSGRAISHPFYDCKLVQQNAQTVVQLRTPKSLVRQWWSFILSPNLYRVI